MEILTRDIDERIKANNILIKMSLEEYYDISKEILENNEFQRKRVKSSSSVYSLLKSDLEQGCLIPTIFLALEEDTNDLTNDEIIKLIKLKRDKIVILDGLQRSYTICDLLKELKDQPTLIDKVKKNRIRIELYTGINKIGILYRMLTLNTGQTPMSMRHQLEIIYSDYLNRNILGIKLIREVDEITPCNKGEYKFSDIIEGGCSMVGGINACCFKTIGPEGLSCVNLSSILPRYKMSEFAKQKEMTLQDCMRKLNGLDMSLLLKAQEMLEGLLVASNERGL